MIDTSKIMLAPRIITRKIFHKDFSERRWEAESPPCRPKRRVSFSDTDTVHTVISRDDISIEEKSNSWYNRHEFLFIRTDNNRIIKKIRAGLCNVDSLDNEARGLEYKTRVRTHLRESIKTEALLSVLEEQDMQEELYGVVMDTKKIAKVYGRICEECQLQAIKRAEIDARLVSGECDKIPLSEIAIPTISPSVSTKRSCSRKHVFSVLKKKTARIA